jgi:4-hydroxythreonine-4-phosphate dehydrogenase
MGDPAGIGPELAVRAARLPEIASAMDIAIYGCPDVLEEAARRFSGGVLPEIVDTGSLKFGDLPAGRENAECGVAALDAVTAAVKDVLAGRRDAIVTCPMNKASVNLAGIPFTGHTEYIAALCGCGRYAMMQSAGALRMVFVTTHIPLNRVSAEVTAERILEVGRLLNDVVRREGVATPRLAAAALNPHAGEQGYMGHEDEDIVKPALARLNAEGIRIEGPFPPDTLFIESIRNRFDGIVSMYHDQGHIPFKMLAFDRGVNSTLGLPIIRTSVDHGTAFEIAWQGKADLGSLTAALRLAALRASAGGV